MSNKPTSKSPDFKLVSGIREIDAAWKKTTQDGKEFLSVLIEDPTFSINCALFQTEAGGYVLTWNRQRERD